MNKTFRITEFKFLEFQFELFNDLCSEWFVFELSTRTNQDHEGIVFNFEFMKVILLSITFYDSRHYDWENE